MPVLLFIFIWAIYLFIRSVFKIFKKKFTDLFTVTVDFSRDKTADTGGFEVVHQISLLERGKRKFWDNIPGNFDDTPGVIETENNKEKQEPEPVISDAEMEYDDNDDKEIVDVRPKRVFRDDIKNVLDLKWVGFHKMTNNKLASNVSEEKKKPLTENRPNIRKKKLKASKK